MPLQVIERSLIWRMLNFVQFYPDLSRKFAHPDSDHKISSHFNNFDSHITTFFPTHCVNTCFDDEVTDCQEKITLIEAWTYHKPKLFIFVHYKSANTQIVWVKGSVRKMGGHVLGGFWPGVSSINSLITKLFISAEKINPEGPKSRMW